MSESELSEVLIKFDDYKKQLIDLKAENFILKKKLDALLNKIKVLNEELAKHENKPSDCMYLMSYE